ncbi:MAG: 4a-hydroxytetrahydrobiopterin dehydratase [Saprospiraceae bacterium]|nr:4a-hydroxytetrahydrobiopterin dehydratase [Saprospiraceae bacterium]
MWLEENNRLSCEFIFKDFAEAMGFINEIALKAERMNHHPNWSNSFNKVSIQLYTHDAGNTITERDRKLAELITRVFEKYKK